MSILVVDDFGCFVGKSGDSVVVRKGKEVLVQRPFEELSCINLEGGGISISVDAIHECARRGITINCVGFDGEPYAKVISPMLTATVKTRREQLDAYDDARGVEISRQIITAKLTNQRNLLRYFAKYRKQSAPELFSALMAASDAVDQTARTLTDVTGACIDECRARIMNIEAQAAVAYWNAVWSLLPEDLEVQRRVHQGATDPVNCMLNYGYGVLNSHCWSAVLLAGLDPFGGFLHVDRPGRPSLVLDLQEVFRQPVVDRTVLGMLGLGIRIEFDEPGRIARDSRRRLAAAVIERLSTPTDTAGGRRTLSTIIVDQARALAVAVRGEKPFRGFRMGW